MNARLLVDTCGFCKAPLVLIQTGRRQRIRLGISATLHTIQHRVMPMDLMGTPAGQRIWTRWKAGA